MTKPKLVDLGGGIRVHPGVLHPEVVPVDAVTPHPANPRRGDKAVIGRSLAANHMYQPIRVQRSTGFILAGNHTHAALAEKGATEVPVIYLDVSDDDAARIMADDNHTADFGTYDDHALLDLLNSLGDTAPPSSYDGDEELLAILARRVEAEDVFTVGTDHMMDEFREISGQDPNGYEPEYARKTVVFLRDQAAIDDFTQRLGLTDPLGKDLNYPLDWVPNDRRKRREEEPETRE